MSDLRSRCLTAMTEAMVDEGPTALYDDLAFVSLDALLGVLEEKPDEWEQEAIDATGSVFSTTLLSVLKPTTEEE